MARAPWKGFRPWRGLTNCYHKNNSGKQTAHLNLGIPWHLGDLLFCGCQQQIILSKLYEEHIKDCCLYYTKYVRSIWMFAVMWILYWFKVSLNLCAQGWENKSQRCLSQTSPVAVWQCGTHLLWCPHHFSFWSLTLKRMWDGAEEQHGEESIGLYSITTDLRVKLRSMLGPVWRTLPMGPSFTMWLMVPCAKCSPQK